MYINQRKCVPIFPYYDTRVLCYKSRKKIKVFHFVLYNNYHAVFNILDLIVKLYFVNSKMLHDLIVTLTSVNLCLIFLNSKFGFVLHVHDN